MTHGSLFSGIGGFDYAADMMGWRNAFHCEINEFCTKILKYHFPDAEHYDDITKTDFTRWRGRIDVLSGGFPCQPFSVAGQRKGTEDDRYLWPQMLRAIREIRPAWVVGENVAGILTMVQPGTELEVGREASLFGEDNRKRVLLRQQYVVDIICQDLEREGYSVQPFVIPACAVGAPHRRDRVWIVARRITTYSADTRPESLQCGREDGVHAAGVTFHPDLNRQRERAYQQITVAGFKGASYDCTGCEDGVASNPQSSGIPRECEQRQGKEKSYRRNIEDNSTLPADRWHDFPTQPPVCGRDDGISARLDGITFPKWRAESVKAYGNAVVPQVVYEIFKAIEETYKDIQP